jgi:peptidase E
MRHIVAMGGGGFLMEPENPRLDDYVLALSRRSRPRICYVGTAAGDSPSMLERFYRAFPASRASATHLPLFQRDTRDLARFLLGQDVVYVGGGNVANMMAVWRLHGVDRILREAWRRGIVLAGVSAGAICWFEGGTTDSFGPQLAPFRAGLKLVPGTVCVHYDGEARRRPVYHALVRDGLPAGIALDDGAAAHYVGARRMEIVTSRPNAGAYAVARTGGRVVETALPVRYLGA